MFSLLQKTTPGKNTFFLERQKSDRQYICVQRCVKCLHIWKYDSKWSRLLLLHLLRQVPSPPFPRVKPFPSSPRSFSSGYTVSIMSPPPSPPPPPSATYSLTFSPLIPCPPLLAVCRIGEAYRLATTIKVQQVSGGSSRRRSKASQTSVWPAALGRKGGKKMGKRV